METREIIAGLKSHHCEDGKSFSCEGCPYREIALQGGHCMNALLKDAWETLEQSKAMEDDRR